MGIGRGTLLGSSYWAGLVGGMSRTGGLAGSLGTVTTPVLNAANISVNMWGFVRTEDEQSHTIDTSGLSAILVSMGQAPTFSNAGSTIKIGIAPMDTSIASAGDVPRPSNTAGVVNFDVSKSIVGGSFNLGSAGTAHWMQPGAGSKTIANGDLVCVSIQMTSRGGSDSCVFSLVPHTSQALNIPACSSYSGSAYSMLAAAPSCLIRFSDGKFGWFEGGSGNFYNSTSSNAVQDSSNPDEYGNLFRLPVPMFATGFAYETGHSNAAATYELRLYSDPLGTPALMTSMSINPRQMYQNAGQVNLLLPTPLRLNAYTDYVVALKATGTATTSISGANFVDTSVRHLIGGVVDGYGVTRNNLTGAFAAQVSGVRKNNISVLVGAFHDGVRSSFGKGF